MPGPWIEPRTCYWEASALTTVSILTIQYKHTADTWSCTCIKQNTVEPLVTDISIIRTPLYYGQFTWSLSDWNPYKAYFSKTDTSLLRTVHLVPERPKSKNYSFLSNSQQERKLCKVYDRQKAACQSIKKDQPDKASYFKEFLWTSWQKLGHKIRQKLIIFNWNSFTIQTPCNYKALHYAALELVLMTPICKLDMVFPLRVSVWQKSY